MSKSSDYPQGWDEFAAQVKKEAGWRCERCKHVHDPRAGYCLTVHHLTNDKAQPFSDRWAFAALCQRCHLTIQCRVDMAQLFFDAIISVSPWFKPHLDGYLKAQEEARKRQGGMENPS